MAGTAQQAMNGFDGRRTRIRALLRDVAAAAVLVLLLVNASCRGDRNNAAHIAKEPVGAGTGEKCNERLARLREDLERVPQEWHYNRLELLDLPEAPPAAPPTKRSGRLLLLREEYFEYSATPWQWNDTATIRERVLAGESSTPRTVDAKPILYALFANRMVSVRNLAFVMRTVLDARKNAPTEFELILQRQAGTYQPYSPPDETPERVKQLYRDLGDLKGAGEYEEELARANRGCAALGDVLKDEWGVRSLLEHRLRADVLQ